MSLGRVANIAANGSPTDAQKYVAYKYLGASMVVDANHPAVPTGLKLTYAGAASGDYSGLDRFGRVVWQRWLRSNGASAADRHFYGYDRAGNRTWRAERANLSDAGGRDEAYVYDKLDRLIGAKRGILPDKPYQAPYPGDATLDGTVDLSDYTVLSLNWLGSGKTWTQADFNGDGKVDGFDNTILGDNWLTDPNETVARSWSWSLTPTGNWSSSMINDANQTRTHDNANQITSISGVALAPLYDQAGNNVRGPRPADPNANNAAHFRYDAWNRLATIHLDDGGTSGTLDANDQLLEACQYDGLMRRTARVTREAVGATPVWRRTDYYHNENWQVVEEWRRTMPVGADPQGTYICSHSALSVYAQYVWDLSYIDSPVCRVRSTETVYYTFDGNRNVTALLNASTGSVVERYLYDPYGRVTVLNGAAGAEKDPNVAEWSPDADNKSDWDNEVLFCGYWYDPETGLFHVRERYYDPVTGTWKTRDRILYPDGMNLYEYVRSGPIGRSDPLGEKWTRLMNGDGQPSTLWEASKGETDFTRLMLAIRWEYGTQAAPTREWVCLKPTPKSAPKTTPAKMREAWDKGNAAECGVYDVGNIIDRGGFGNDFNGLVGESEKPIWGNQDILYGDQVYREHNAGDFAIYATAHVLWGNAVPGSMQGVAMGNAIAEAAGRGKTPIRYLTLLGHSSNGDERLWRYPNSNTAGTSFSLADLHDDARANGSTTFENAMEGTLPRLCWFRHDAIVRVVGCETAAVANSLAGILRRGARSVGTTVVLKSFTDIKGQSSVGLVSRLVRPPGNTLVALPNPPMRDHVIHKSDLYSMGIWSWFVGRVVN